MQNLRQIMTGMLLALISIAVVLGGFTLATAEGRKNSTPPTETSEPLFATRPPEQPTAVEQLPSATPRSITETPSITKTAAATLLAGVTNTLSPTPTAGLTATGLPTNTALPTITPGLSINTPWPTATSWPTVYVPCGAPAGWVNYYVVAGDTLYSIGLRYGVTVLELQRANCLGSSIYIQVGKVLKVPYFATAIPYLSPTPYPTTIDVPTVTPELPTAEPPTAEPPTAEPPTPEPPTLEPPTPEIPTATPFSGVG